MFDGCLYLVTIVFGLIDWFAVDLLCFCFGGCLLDCFGLFVLSVDCVGDF